MTQPIGTSGITPASKPAPLPKGPGFLGNLGKSIGDVAQGASTATRTAGRAVTYKPPRSGGSDAATSGPGYGSVQANAYKTTPAYHKAVLDVFALQSAKDQKTIWKFAKAHPDLPESQAILKPSHGFFAPLGGAKIEPRGAAALEQKGPLGKIIANAGKDLVDLPAETLATAGTIGGDVASGKFGKAANDVFGPIVQTVEHPVKSFIAHPLYTTWIGGGLVHGMSRLAAAPVKALAPESALGRAVSTQREGVALTGNLTRERAPYSTSPTIKLQQKAGESVAYRRAPDGTLVPKTKWLRDRQLNQGVGQLVGVAERVRRVNQEQVKAARLSAIQPSRLARVGHAAKTTLAYDPKQAAVPGADVLSRIADTTVRRPDTYTQDLLKHAEQVSANRPNLLEDPRALKAHDAYVKTLLAEAGKNRTPKSLGPAFAAAETYARDYKPVESTAHSLGHFGADMTREGLQRRELQHYAVTHMGARHDEFAGLVRSATKPEVRAEIQRLRPQQHALERRIEEGRGGVQTHVDLAAVKGRIRNAWNNQVVPLSTNEILAHIKGPEGTGGRMPAFTSDRVRFDNNGRSSFYVPSERRPLPTTAKNTLYAYTHGLTDASHQSLLEQHALMQGIVDSHRAQNGYADTLHVQMPGGGYAKTYAEAQSRLGGTGLQPINLAQIFHPQAALNQALEHGGVSPATIEEEAVRRSLDLSNRLHPSAGEGRWAGIDPQALKALKGHENQIQPNVLLRTIRGLNNQFRTVALSTSAKHLPGVAQENVIRDIAQGVGFRSWITGRRILGAMEKTNPERANEVRTQLTGGQVAGMTEAGKVYHVSDHWTGTSAYPFLKAFEVASKTPGTRQLRAVWRGWTKLAINGTKKALEQQHQIAGLGKFALREHGYAEAARTAGMMGLIHRAFGLHGQMLEDAAKGMFDPKKARQARAVIDQIYGKWTDLSPGAQTALMFSPFGLWWANSARFLARMPIDQPIKTGLLAGATEGTAQERQARGLDMFMKGGLPAFEQGGIPLPGGQVLAQNYYSPFGVANDPIATGQSLIQPWMTPMVTGALGVNWLGKPLSSPSNPRGYKAADTTHKVQYILDSALSSFVPLYTKARQVMEGGASAYDTTDNGLNPMPPATKTPGKGAGAGLLKAVQPFRKYKGTSGGGASSGYLLGGASTSGNGGYLLGGQSSGGSAYLLP